MSRYRYRRYDGGPDPLAPPFDAGAAVDALAEGVLDGRTTRQALRDLWERGWRENPGLQAWREEINRRRRELRDRGRADGLLTDLTHMLDSALTTERAELFADPGDDARFAEAQLDNLPDSTARAVRELRDYQWRSPDAARTYQQILDRLRRDVLDQQFADITASLRDPADPEQTAALKQMLADLNELMAAHRRGEDVEEAYEQFRDKHQQFFPDAPEAFEDFLDDLARRAAAGQRLLESLTDEQRAELADLTSQTFDDELLGALGDLTDNLRALRPDLAWSGGQPLQGERGLGLPDATAALADLADLDALADQLGPGYAGVDPADIDEEAVRRQLGRSAADQLAALQSMQDSLRHQGYLTDTLELTPKAVRRLAAAALRQVFADLDDTGRGEHDNATAGASGEFTGATRPWQFGDEQPLDTARTLTNALRRTPPGEPLRLSVEDFEVRETEDRSRAAVALLVDRSFSMVVNDTWRAAKTTALALYSLASSAFPADAVEIIAFGHLAERVPPMELPDLAAPEMQGTNLHHALLLAGRFFDRHRDAQPICLVVTDGEPTAHLTESGDWWFDWPPSPQTINATVAEVDRLTRRGVQISWFRLGDEPRLERFLDAMAQRNGGRVLAPTGGRLGDYVVRDYVRRRTSRR